MPLPHGVRGVAQLLETRLVHLGVEDCSEELARQQSYAIKNQLGHPKPLLGNEKYPHWGVFCLLLAGSLWHKGAYNRTFPCMEANYPYAIKNQRGASKKPLVGGFLRSKAPSRGLWMRGAGSLWHKRHWRSNTMKLSTNESRASLELDQ